MLDKVQEEKFKTDNSIHVKALIQTYLEHNETRELPVEQKSGERINSRNAFPALGLGRNKSCHLRTDSGASNLLLLSRAKDIGEQV